MRDLRLAVGVIAIVALAACGSKDVPPGASSGTGRSGSSASAAATGPASAEQVAKEARGNVNCPAKVTTSVVAGGPVIDVVGLRPGITYEEAANIVLCDNPMLVAELDTSTSFNIQTYGQTVRQGFGARFAEARVEKTARQFRQELQDEAMARGTNSVRQDMKPGQVKFHVGTMGVPGQERAIYAAREEWFTEGKNPAVDVVAKALTGKYGDTTRSQETDKYRILTWAYDPNGRRLTETSPLYNECRGVSDPDGDANFTADCGIVVQAQIGSLPGNQGLAQYLQVGVIDQAGGYAAISDTESALHKLDEDRKAKELKDATKNADVPKL